MYYRQKILLALLQTFGGELPKTDLQKYLFLFTEEYQKEKSYEFIPYKYGVFSFQSYADLRKLRDIGVVVESEYGWRISNKDKNDYFSGIGPGDRRNFLLLKKKYEEIKGNDLIRKTYSMYPYYAIKSEKAETLMSKNQLRIIKQEKPSQADYAFFTIGYEGKSFENYLNRLIKNNIRILCDVRKNAISRKYGFSKKNLSETLEKIDIDYIHMPELGIVSEKRKSLNSKADYKLLLDDYEISTLRKNRNALENLHRILKKYGRVAITCFEADQRMCHRNRIAEAMSRLPAWKYEISHI